MRLVTWTIGLVVFLVLMGFAAKNVEPVTLRFYFDLALQAPLIVIVLTAFAAGVLAGIVALLATLLRQRREIGRLRREQQAPETPSFPPLAGL